MSNTSLTFPHETVEFLPVEVTNSGTAVTTFETALVVNGARPAPADWKPAVVVSGKHGLMVQGLARNVYGIWVRVTSAPETVVVGPNDPQGAGFINIT